MPIKNKKKEVYLGIDYGKSNIGLALGINDFVTPLEIIPAKNEEVAIHKIIRIGLENKVDKFIIGIPLDAEGKETKQSIETRRFGRKLKIMSKRPIIYQNEFGTSKQALKNSIEQGVSQKGRRSIDNLSASIILRSYFYH